MAPKSKTGYDMMYTGLPSESADLTKKRGFGLVEGDGDGVIDNANTMKSGDPVNGLHSGKRQKVETELEQS